MHSKTYTIDSQYAGLIIGKRGVGIKALQQMSGVFNVSLETRSSKCYLKVSARSGERCEEVFAEVQLRITMQTGRKQRIPIVGKTYIVDVEPEMRKILLKTTLSGEHGKQAIVAQNRYVKETFFPVSWEKVGLEDSFAGLELLPAVNKTNDFIPFSRADIVKSFEQALQSAKDASHIKFNVSPGKIVFRGDDHQKSRVILRNTRGCLTEAELKGKNLRPFFNTFLNSGFLDQVHNKLKQLDFVNLNENNPDSYTTVHLFVGKEKAHFSVVLALDEDLNEITAPGDDGRLSDDKKEAIEVVFKAKTIGEVLKGHSSAKMAYRKLCLRLHPDKNAHPGATEAFKKLQDAYDAHDSGKSLSTPALEVKLPSEPDGSSKPPKVIKVKSEKKKICTLTTFSPKVVDLRASVVTFKKDADVLSQHVRHTINNCWEKRDTEGGIKTPEGSNEIFIECVKQVTARYVWAKEIQTNQGGVVFEVKVKKIREKINHQADWQECIEIDMDFDNSNAIARSADVTKSAEILAEQFLEIKKLWETLSPSVYK